MAGVTGLEPATSGVTGRHSNQLSYTPAGPRLTGLPRRGAAEISEAPGEVKLARNRQKRPARNGLVGGERLELPTPWV